MTKSNWVTTMLAAKSVLANSRHPGESRDPVSSSLLAVPVIAASRGNKRHWIPAFAGMTALIFALANVAGSAHEEEAVIRNYAPSPAAPAFQTWEDADKKSAGCVSCHTKSDRKTMHANQAVVL